MVGGSSVLELIISITTSYDSLARISTYAEYSGNSSLSYAGLVQVVLCWL